MTDIEKKGSMEMDQPVDCQIFADQLDALARGELPVERTQQLRVHADACPDCAMALKVQEHLLGPSLQTLESRVPDTLVASVWPGVQASAGGSHNTAAALRPRLGRTAFLLAAASLVLLFSTGFLAVRTTRLTTKTAALTQQVAEQQRWLAALGGAPGIDPVARTAALGGRSPFTRALSRSESISVAELRRLLGRLPAQRVILSQTQLEEVLRGRVLTAPPILREALSRLDGSGGVRAHQLEQALEAVDVNQGATVSTADLVDLLS